MDCKSAVGGLRKQVWILGDSGNTISNYATDVDGLITSISGTGNFYKIEITRGSSSFSETLAVNDATNSLSFTPSLALQIPKLDNSNKNFFQSLSTQPYIYVIIQTMDGKYWLLGKDNGLTVSEGTLQSGTAATDLVGFTITLVGQEATATSEIDAATETELSALMSGITISL
ncbi:MAG: hypothetical protein OEZ01_13320 [Candidatus Heimdallarchaeota archaeon]|nr:hypothetical protein [Candidatus Heimdallarchaeota archaeon]